MPEPTDPNTVLEDKLFPCIRARVTFDLQNSDILERRPLKREEKKEGFTGKMLYFPFGTELAAGLIFDNGESFVHVRDVELAQWNISFKAAMEIAAANLRKLSPPKFRLVQQGLYVSNWRDMHDIARLMLPEMFAELEVDGDMVALAANADMLFVTGSEDVVGMELLLMFGNALSATRPVPMVPVVWRQNSWQVLNYHPDHPNFDRFNDFRQHALRRQYDVQLEQLNREYKETIFVSPYLVEQDESGEFYTKAIVPEGRRTSIPVCDVWEFFRFDNEGQIQCIARSPMARAVSALGVRIEEEVGLYPPRYLLKSFPDSSQVPAIGLDFRNPLASALKSDRSDIAVIQSLFSIQLPRGARLDGDVLYSENSLSQTVVVPAISRSVLDDLRDFFMKALHVGYVSQIATEYGEVTRVISRQAGIIRQVDFAPGQIKGEIVVKLTKTTDFTAQAVTNALASVDDMTSQIERLFRISIFPGSKLTAPLKQADTSFGQQFSAEAEPIDLVNFYQVQLSDDAFVLHEPHLGSPYFLENGRLGVTIVIDSHRSEAGTNYVISLSVRG